MDSSPFSREATVNMRAGKLEAQLGRKAKPVNPDFGLSGSFANMAMGRVVVKLKVSIDDSGKVTNVELMNHGRNEIDLPTVVALYKWWIEPRTDKQGKTWPDVILLDMVFD